MAPWKERRQPLYLRLGQPQKVAHHHPRQFGSLHHAGKQASRQLIGPALRAKSDRNHPVSPKSLNQPAQPGSLGRCLVKSIKNLRRDQVQRSALIWVSESLIITSQPVPSGKTSRTSESPFRADPSANAADAAFLSQKTRRGAQVVRACISPLLGAGPEPAPSYGLQANHCRVTDQTPQAEQA